MVLFQFSKDIYIIGNFIILEAYQAYNSLSTLETVIKNLKEPIKLF